jgi:hypothetical protein
LQGIAASSPLFPVYSLEQKIFKRTPPLSD